MLACTHIFIYIHNTKFYLEGIHQLLTVVENTNPEWHAVVLNFELHGCEANILIIQLRFSLHLFFQ